MHGVEQAENYDHPQCGVCTVIRCGGKILGLGLVLVQLATSTVDWALLYRARKARGRRGLGEGLAVLARSGYITALMRKPLSPTRASALELFPLWVSAHTVIISSHDLPHPHDAFVARLAC